MISRNGVYYDLTLSEFRCTVDNLTYVFSSQLHLDKFLAKLETHRDIINYSLTKRFNYKVDVSQLADIVLYKKVETRGFLILDDKGMEVCQKRIRYGGGKVTLPNSNEL